MLLECWLWSTSAAGIGRTQQGILSTVRFADGGGDSGTRARALGKD